MSNYKSQLSDGIVGQKPDAIWADSTQKAQTRTGRREGFQAGSGLEVAWMEGLHPGSLLNLGCSAWRAEALGGGQEELFSPTGWAVGGQSCCKSVQIHLWAGCAQEPWSSLFLRVSPLLPDPIYLPADTLPPLRPEAGGGGVALLSKGGSAGCTGSFQQSESVPLCWPKNPGSLR